MFTNKNNNQLVNLVNVRDKSTTIIRSRYVPNLKRDVYVQRCVIH